MNVFDRPMFRKKGGATGIMASGPELIKKANGGTFSFGNIPPAISPIPIRQNIASAFERAFPLTSNQIDVGSSNLMGVEGPSTSKAKQTELERLTELAQVRNPFIKKQKQEAERKGDLTVDSLGDINQTTKNILDKKPKSPEAKNLGARRDKDDPMPGGSFDDTVSDTEATAALKKPTTATRGFDTSGVRERILNEQQAIQDAFKSFNLGEIDKANILGDTYQNHTKNFFEALNKRPEEVTFEDVSDSAFDLLGFDKKTLDEKLTKDQQGSIWLNMMRAGLAMAAGESENFLTNVAKGFQVGLEGYGKDMRTLTEDYREDVKTYQNTMYRFLRDKKSEEIAKNALDVQRKTAEFQIIREFRGEMRRDALQKLNNEVTLRKLKIGNLTALHQIDFEKMKLDKGDAEFQKMLEIHKAKIAALLPDEVKAAQGMGYIELIDKDKLATADNLQLTQKGVDASFDLMKAIKDSAAKYRPSEAMQKITISGSMGGFGIKAAPNAELSDTQQKQLGKVVEDLGKSTSRYQKALDPLEGNPAVALSILIDEYKPLYNTSGGKIILDYNDLPTFIRQAIEKRDEATLKIFAKNRNIIVNTP